MDVASLRAELEEQIAKIPHDDAPDGFRDRFDHVAEDYAAGEGSFPKSVLEEQLRQIRAEAEAAAKAGAGEAAEGKPTGGDEIPVGGTAPPRHAGAPAAPEAGGGQQRMMLLVGLAVVVLAAAYFYFR